MAKRSATKKTPTSRVKASPRPVEAAAAPVPSSPRLHLVRDGQEGVYSHSSPARLYQVAAREDRDGTAWTIRDDDGATVARFNRAAKTWEAVSRS